MLKTLVERWWVLLLRGVLAIAFGVTAFAMPGLTMATLVILFGAFALVDGIFVAVGAVANRKETENWALLTMLGLLGVLIGVMTFRAPGATALGLLLYISIWAMAKGFMEIAVAIRLRKEINNEWMLVLAGILSILLAVFILWDPAAGAIGILWAIAAYSVVFGLLMIALSLVVRSKGKEFGLIK
jgi:uncharacterized membrane protein HdeD (DUF308 family)